MPRRSPRAPCGVRRHLSISADDHWVDARVASSSMPASPSSASRFMTISSAGQRDEHAVTFIGYANVSDRFDGRHLRPREVIASDQCPRKNRSLAVAACRRCEQVRESASAGDCRDAARGPIGPSRVGLRSLYERRRYRPAEADADQPASPRSSAAFVLLVSRLRGWKSGGPVSSRSFAAANKDYSPRSPSIE